MTIQSRIAIVATHPIQHFCPQYRSLGRHPSASVRVFFWTLKGLDTYQDRDFARAVSWDPDMISGLDYSHVDASVPRLREELTSFDPEWVVVYGYRTPAARAARAWARKNKRRIAYISDTEERHAEAWWRRWRRRVLMRTIFPSVDRFLTVGDANEAFYRACGVPEHKLLRMHFPIDPAMFAHPPDASEVRSSLGVADGALMVLTVGKLIQRKRQADLIEATHGFSPQDLHLVVVGSGPDMSRLQGLAGGRNNITFTGFLSPSELPALYSTADVYAHVSDMDPHPLAVSEAAAGGCVLVVSDAVGSWGWSDDVRPGETGEVVPMGDVQALERVLTRLAGDRKSAQVMAARARLHAEEHQRVAHGGFLDALFDTTKVDR